jgi:hypothetical protein
MTRAFALLLLSGIFGLLAGCCNLCERRPLFCRKDAPPPKTVYVPPGAPVPIVPGASAPMVVPPNGTFPTVPPPPSISPLPADSKSRFEPNWKPTEGREPPRDSRIQLYAPEPIDKEKPRSSDEPPAAKKPIVQGAFPPIPQFGVAKENAYAGLHPGPAGFDWLKAKGVKTIVKVQLFGENDAPDRKEAEARGMRFEVFEVSPVRLSKEKADEFIKLVRDGAKSGIFVYDEDGSLAGAMWYLYLRWGESLDDDPSQLRARSLGLDPNRDGQHRDMWLAVQKVLSENNR